MSVMLARLPSSPAGAVECAVDLAENSLSQAEPLAKMLQSLRAASLHVTTLRLHKNRYDDSAAETLAEHIREAADQGQPLMQLHLSNNSLSEAGLWLLIAAAHRSKGYPRSTDCAKLKSLGADSGRRVLWLRAENQDPPIARPRDFLDACSSSGMPVCVLADGSGQKPPVDAVVQMHEYFLSASHTRSSAKGSGRAKGQESKSGMGGPPARFGNGKGKGKYESLSTASGMPFKVVQRGDGVICIHGGACTDDAELEGTAIHELDKLLARLPSSPAGAVECAVDLAENSLSQAEPLAKMLQSLREASLHVTTLRLHKNRYDDSAAETLAEHIREAADQGQPLMQLHLSNNSLSEAGLWLLIEAAHRSKGYPRSTDCAKLKSLGADSGRRVLWLRAENQDPPIARPRDFLDACSSSGMPVCVLADGSGQKPPVDAVVQMHEYFLSASHTRSSAKGSGRAKGQESKSGMGGPPARFGNGKGKGKYESLTTASGMPFKVVQRGDGVICIHGGACTDDAELEGTAIHELDKLLARLPSSPAGAVECAVDLAENSLSQAEPLARMLQSLREASLHVTTLRLHKNRYDDSAAETLAEHIREAADQGRPLMQLHLSNNSLSEAGLWLLIEAAHRSKGYPRSTDCAKLKSLGADSGRRVLWLRAENQDPPIARPRDFLDACSSSGMPVCVLADGSGQKPPVDAVVQMHEYFLKQHSPGRLRDCFSKFSMSYMLRFVWRGPSR